MTAAEVLAAYDDIDTHGYHAKVKTMNIGTGLIAPATTISNGILIQFELSPPGLDGFIDNPVNIDITRRKNWAVKSFDAAGNVMYTCTLPFPEKHPDAANDDGSADDESIRPDDESHMYSYDAPGASVTPEPGMAKDTLVAEFEEFVRINIKRGGADRPNGSADDLSTCTPNSTLDGSRASDKYEWSLKHTLKEEDGKMVRTTGNENETDENNVRVVLGS
jgi:hypothetical protein